MGKRFHRRADCLWIAVVVATLALLLVACRGSAPTDLHAAGWHEASIPVGENQRWFRVYVPQQLPDEAPVVVLLHGGTQSMRKIFRDNAGGSRAWLDVVEREGVLLLVPNGANPRTGNIRGDSQNWNDLRPPESARGTELDDVAFINQLLDWAASSYAIDPGRVYVTGASNGGMMTYRLLIETPERFAAAAAFISSLPDDPALVPQPAGATPLMIVNGTADPLVKWEGGEVRGRSGGQTMSVEANVAWWVAANRADAEAAVTTMLPDDDPGDGCRLYETVYPALSGGAPVVFVKMDGGGHAMPSVQYEIPQNIVIDGLIGPVCKDVEGAELAWAFMEAYRR